MSFRYKKQTEKKTIGYATRFDGLERNLKMVVLKIQLVCSCVGDGSVRVATSVMSYKETYGIKINLFVDGVTLHGVLGGARHPGSVLVWNDSDIYTNIQKTNMYIHLVVRSQKEKK